MKQPSRSKLRDQVGIVLLISGVVVAMGVSAMAARGLKTWVGITGLAVGLVLVAIGLWLARTFRNKDPNRPHRPDEE